ncbi:MAG: hypothetical protein QOK29_1466 [Rhodospirillaceae bacterium]|jgi:hypothetical protein|nr:hypothetical protein [Rhodospirillaceae bacterium]
MTGCGVSPASPKTVSHASPASLGDGAPVDAVFEASYTDVRSVIQSKRFDKLQHAFQFLCDAYRRGRIMHPRIEALGAQPYLRQGRQLLFWIRTAKD